MAFQQVLMLELLGGLPLIPLLTPQNGYAYTTVTQHYDANAAYQANLASTNQMLTLGQMMENDCTIREQGYLKTTTVYPNESIVGYMNIKRKKGEILSIKLTVNGHVYSFNWNVSTRK